ncbi:hypothetical protein GCM10010844_23190 [Deinococcus radiotolerans]|uniref:Uncharacterized protein n=1 Tax=Deinococcus radiotolerans TaxID=1309407 RepID=A0ABQ2FKB5_9DEIO|nr:hypothetical protein GCM10010844_23190 [Deinococcus radiotolerans]
MKFWAETPLGFVTLMVNCVVEPRDTLAGLNPLLITVVRGVTVRFAVLDAAPRVGVSVLLTPLVTFGFTPTCVARTLTVMVQLAPAARVGTVRFKLVAPTVRSGLLVAPQVPPMLVLATLMPDRASVKFRLVSTGFPAGLGLLTVNVTVLVLFRGMEVGENVLEMVAAA